MVGWGKTHYLPRGSRIATTASWAHSPNIVWENLRSWQFVCLPTLHLLSLDYLRRGFRRTPANHTMRLTWTLLTMPPLNYTITGTLILHSTIFRWRQVKYSCDTSSFTLSGWLVPTLWSLVLISLAVTSAVYVRYSAPYTYPLVEYVPHWYSVGD
jgi:hypothetical protein